MKKIIDINWELLGAHLAVLSEKEQSEFFTGFAKELTHYGGTHHIELQLFSVNDKLKDDVKKILSAHLPCLWYNE